MRLGEALRWMSILGAVTAMCLLSVFGVSASEVPGIGEARSGTSGATPGTGTPTPPAQPPSAQKPPTLWHHNGSTMYLVATGASREFYYDSPRPGMVDVGARRGTLLFRGEAGANGYDGTAWIFNRQCGQFPYRVSGAILEGGRRVLLTGHAPRVNLACQITGYLVDSLDFALIER